MVDGSLLFIAEHAQAVEHPNITGADRGLPVLPTGLKAFPISASGDRAFAEVRPGVLCDAPAIR
jgi:hypothetical protein